jgi:hypothetical protein
MQELNILYFRLARNKSLLSAEGHLGYRFSLIAFPFVSLKSITQRLIDHAVAEYLALVRPRVLIAQSEGKAEISCASATISRSM